MDLGHSKACCHGSFLLAGSPKATQSELNEEPVQMLDRPVQIRGKGK